ncbi:MAG: hypothetical protein RJB60_98 [Pseudomonadota bacterium]|jgi:phage/conjugal plasmid C-4 type zinc finger TraR family protein
MDEKHFEQASANEANAVADGLGNVHRAIQSRGQSHCEDCGDPIAAARRKAAPFAIRCIACQGAFELLGSQYAKP